MPSSKLIRFAITSCCFFCCTTSTFILVWCISSGFPCVSHSSPHYYFVSCVVMRINQCTRIRSKNDSLLFPPNKKIDVFDFWQKSKEKKKRETRINERTESPPKFIHRKRIFRKARTTINTCEFCVQIVVCVDVFSSSRFRSTLFRQIMEIQRARKYAGHHQFWFAYALFWYKHQLSQRDHKINVM